MKRFILIFLFLPFISFSQNYSNFIKYEVGDGYQLRTREVNALCDSLYISKCETFYYERENGFPRNKNIKNLYTIFVPNSFKDEFDREKDYFIPNPKDKWDEILRYSFYEDFLIPKNINKYVYNSKTKKRVAYIDWFHENFYNFDPSWDSDLFLSSSESLYNIYLDSNVFLRSSGLIYEDGDTRINTLSLSRNYTAFFQHTNSMKPKNLFIDFNRFSDPKFNINLDNDFKINFKGRLGNTSGDIIQNLFHGSGYANWVEYGLKKILETAEDKSKDLEAKKSFQNIINGFNRIVGVINKEYNLSQSNFVKISFGKSDDLEAINGFHMKDKINSFNYFERDESDILEFIFEYVTEYKFKIFTEKPVKEYIAGKEYSFDLEDWYDISGYEISKDWETVTKNRINVHSVKYLKIHVLNKVMGVEVENEIIYDESIINNLEYEMNRSSMVRLDLDFIRRNDHFILTLDDKPIYTTKHFNFKYNTFTYSPKYKINNFGLNSRFNSLDIQNLITIDETEINGNESEWKGNGSGLIISTSGHIVTNNHVIEDMDEIEVDLKINNQFKSYKAEVILVDKNNDLAVLKINNENLNIDYMLYNIEYNTADVGKEVFALGYPLSNIMGEEVKFTDGRISSKTGFQGDISTYQTTTPIQPGNSGGPLFDFDGNLIGINSSGLSKEITDNVSYTIKSRYLINLFDGLDNVSIPKNKSLQNISDIELIKELSKYVVLIKVK